MSWNVDPSLTVCYQKQATKSPSWLVQRICLHSIFCTIDESNEVEVVFDCNVCFVWDLLIIDSHRPTSRPNFNLDCNHMGQRRYGGNCRLLRRWVSEDIIVRAWTGIHIPHNTMIRNNWFMPLPPKQGCMMSYSSKAFDYLPVFDNL